MPPAPQPKPVTYSVKETPDGFAVQRNGASVKTPGGEPLVLPTLSLANAIVDELQAGPGFDAAPLAQMASQALDSVNKQRAKTLDDILAFANSELLCHRSDGGSELADAEEETWQPLLSWCADEFDAPLESAPGIKTISQSPQSIMALRRAVETYDCFRLTGLLEATRRSGSIVLGLAMAEKRITPDEAFHAAELATTHQIKKYGEDPELMAMRATVYSDLCLCEKWFALIN